MWLDTPQISTKDFVTVIMTLHANPNRNLPASEETSGEGSDGSIDGES